MEIVLPGNNAEGSKLRVGRDELRKRIKCPKCEVFMRQEEIEVSGPNIVIDHCQLCGSYWFDKGELNKYLKDRIPDKLLKKASGLGSWGKTECPRCKGVISIKFINDLEVDHCEHCGGLWLDHGELKKLQESDIGKLPESRLKNIFSRLKEKVS
jgi:Zn-finger nucleic acid-binding protein